MSREEKFKDYRNISLFPNAYVTRKLFVMLSKG